MPIEILNVRDFYARTATQTIKALICGPPGSGKSLSASTWPAPLYLDMEGRLVSVRNRDVHRARITTLHQMEEVKGLLDQPASVRRQMLGVDVKTVVVDTVDELARIVIQERLRDEKQEAMRQQDWGYLSDTLRGLLRGFRNIEDLNVVFNCHIKSIEDGETGRIEKRPDIQGSVGNEIAAYVDEAFLLVARPATDPKTGERVVQRYLQTYPDPRHEWIKDHSGTLPQEFPINFTDDYQRLSTFIFGQVTTPSASVTIDRSSDIEGEPAGPAKEPEAAPRRRGRPLKQRDAEERPAAVEREEAPVHEQKAPSEPVSEQETEPSSNSATDESDAYVCADCGQIIDNPDIAEVAEIRYGVPLCRTDFAGRRAKKS